MRSPQRVNRLDGYKHWDFDARGCSIELAMPKVRAGTFILIGFGTAESAPSAPTDATTRAAIDGLSGTLGLWFAG